MMPGTPWEHWEDTILRRERTIKAAALRLPHRTLDMIAYRRKVLHVGKSNPAHKKWTPEEDRVVLRWFPDKDRVRRHLPHRSLEAIKHRALDVLKLPARRKRWTKEDLKRISTIPEGGLAALSTEVHRPISAIHNARIYHGLTTKQTTDMSRAPQVVADIREHVVRIGLTPSRVGSNHGDYHALSGRQIPRYRALRDIVQSLRGEFYIEWDE